MKNLLCSCDLILCCMLRISQWSLASCWVLHYQGTTNITQKALHSTCRLFDVKISSLETKTFAWAFPSMASFKRWRRNFCKSFGIYKILVSSFFCNSQEDKLAELLYHAPDRFIACQNNVPRPAFLKATKVKLQFHNRINGYCLSHWIVKLLGIQ